MLALSSALISRHFSFPFCHTKQVDPAGRGSTEATREETRNSFNCPREARQAQGMQKERREGYQRIFTRNYE